MNDLVSEQLAQFPLQQSIDKVLKEEKLESALAYIYLNRIKSMGVSRSAGDFRRFEKALKSSLSSGKVSLPISKKRVLKAGVSEGVFVARLQEPVTSDEISAYLDFFGEATVNATEKIIKYEAAAHGRYLKKHGAEILEEHRFRREAFIEKLNSIWGEAIDNYEILVNVAREIGNCALDFIRLNPSDEHNPHKVEAVIQLFGRACHVGEEISVLLANGLADGAQARWRSLHEIQVVIKLLADGDDLLSKRYLDHHDIDLFLEAKATDTFGGSRLHSVHPDDLRDLSIIKDELLENYGKDFICPYGWASELLGFKANRFSDLEKLAGAEYVRPFYKAASASVHASSRGTLSRLGMPPDFDGMLAGSSTYGLFSPATGATHSLVMASVDVAQVSGSVDAMAMAVAIEKLSAQLHKKLEKASRSSENG